MGSSAAEPPLQSSTLICVELQQLRGQVWRCNRKHPCNGKHPSKLVGPAPPQLSCPNPTLQFDGLRCSLGHELYLFVCRGDSPQVLALERENFEDASKAPSWTASFLDRPPPPANHPFTSIHGRSGTPTASDRTCFGRCRRQDVLKGRVRQSLRAPNPPKSPYINTSPCRNSPRVLALEWEHCVKLPRSCSRALKFEPTNSV